MSEKFEFVRPLGRGAFGDVSLYRRKVNGEQVVIKKIAFETSTITEQEHKKTENEVNIIAKFNHLNILQYFENYVENNSMFIVMEYAPGGNLYDYLQSKGKYNLMQEEDVLHLFCQLVAGIQHIHDRKILHRDLKTHNIMLNRTQRVVKIGDFGISKVLESKSKAYTVVGTPCYFSPELYVSKPYNQKSDIWALGCILHEMLTLQRAFEAETLPDLIRKVMAGRTDPISPHYSVHIRELVQSMLNVNPNQRPDIYQIISNPLVFPYLIRLYCDFGMIRPTAVVAE